MNDQLIEQEVKLEVRHVTFLDLLKKHGIKFNVLRPILQRDLIFDFPDLRLLRDDRLFRIRMENDDIRLTFKGKREFLRHSKKRIEIEGSIRSEKAVDVLKCVGISVSKLPCTFKEIVDLLSRNGMKVVVEVVKERTPLRLEGWNCKVYLDKVRRLGEFVEIEGEGSDLLVDILGVSNSVIRKSYAEMLAEFS